MPDNAFAAMSDTDIAINCRRLLLLNLLCLKSTNFPLSKCHKKPIIRTKAMYLATTTPIALKSKTKAIVSTHVTKE